MHKRLAVSFILHFKHIAKTIINDFENSGRGKEHVMFTLERGMRVRA